MIPATSAILCDRLWHKDQLAFRRLADHAKSRGITLLDLVGYRLLEIRTELAIDAWDRRTSVAIEARARLREMHDEVYTEFALG